MQEMRAAQLDNLLGTVTAAHMGLYCVANECKIIIMIMLDVDRVFFFIWQTIRIFRLHDGQRAVASGQHTISGN